MGSPDWRDAIAAVNVANGDHMAEEEREGLTDFRRRVSLPQRHELAVRFVTFEARNFAGVRPVDKDPQEYVRQQEAAARSSLPAGSLARWRLVWLGRLAWDRRPEALAALEPHRALAAQPGVAIGLASDRGSPNPGSRLFSKQVRAQIRSPARVSTRRPVPWRMPVGVAW